VTTKSHPLLSTAEPYFKLICGANLTDYAQLAYLSEVYALAGARLIDVAATPEAVRAARTGIEAARARAERQPAGPWHLAADPFPVLMTSVTASDDPHCRIVVKDAERCTWACPYCLEACPHEAIALDLAILEDRCVGCNLCVPACPHDALAMAYRPFAPSLDPLWQEGARALELHTGGGDRQELLAWKDPCQEWVRRGGLFAVSINGEQLSVPEAVALAREVCDWFPGVRIIVQADGRPISGARGKASTEPALRFAGALLDAGIPAAVQAAGGANDWTGPLAREAGLPLAGVGMGSYARSIMKARIETPSDEALTEDVLRARRLVSTVARDPEV
jgi:Fe-S-cluster-containing hydrogenase component 2